jgi:hypothetical protein
MRKAIIFLPLRRRPVLELEFLPRQPARCLLCSLPCCYVLETSANTRRIDAGKPGYWPGSKGQEGPPR